MRPDADGITIESLRPGDGERRWLLGRQAFGATNEFDPEAPEVPYDQVVAAYDGDALVGTVVTLDFAQTWGGRPVPCGGVSGVLVGPEARGRGLARRMLLESFERMDRRGQVVSALYPTTASLYRSVGYEVVSWYEHRRIPLGEMPTAPAEALQWHRIALDEPGLGALLGGVESAMVAAHDGWFRPDPAWRARNLGHMATEKGVNRYAYVGRREGGDAAAVIHRYVASEGSFYDIEAELLVGIDGPAVAGALGFLAGHGTTAGEVRTTLPRSILAAALPEVQRSKVIAEWPLMLRVVDLVGAIAARGWPVGVTGRVELAVVDDVRRANSGTWVLEVDRGKAALSSGGSGRVELTAPDLAVLYAGGDPRLLRRAGRLAGATPDDLDLLAAAFVSSPTIANFF